ncbi:MAG: tRNA preQ1(34) S-adenosylmethionine ribosyltransferase-isomerase QueA, partial [Alphaproteobacteria bacterium]|nr:tRNA preQ1(34) S-adenosylmethionine ribosyltransferase-isomerase QueA [Alphaproteobacteria bacterium]
MRVELFDFELPRSAIADRPAHPRDAARLLEIGDDFLDRRIGDLPDLLMPGDLLVINDTKVIPARLRGRRGMAQVEVTLHRQDDATSWRAFARPAKRLKIGDHIAFTDDFGADVTDKGKDGEVTLRFDRAGQDFFATLERHGVMPLPPYVSRPSGA